ncbi:FMN-dependent NADH-azoreductase [Alteromonadaceae bacterium Bs31]|nr:FMN-dependent NADH-azoreductase [Alteromonadaceae bacterium Bs31]
MATTVLHIDSSIFGGAGVSNQLGQHLIANIEARGEELNVTHRDLSVEPVPHFSAETITQIGEGKAELADTLIAELIAADVLVLAAPMYNFAIPSSLKAWFDHVARAGTTFKYTENGPVGLLKDKKVFVLTTRGGVHLGAASDTQSAYLKTMLGFLGLNDVVFIYAEGLNMSGDSREQAISKAQAEIHSHVQQLRFSEEAA